MAPTKREKDLSNLRAGVDSATSLISSLQASLISSSSPPSQSDAPNPFRLLHDASTLLKAQTTKLSLLIINKPFTPSAISTIISSISSECLPALMFAFELCRPEQYTKFLREHLRHSIARLLREMTALLQTIPSAEEQEGIEREGRTTLANTGVVWEICDSLISLANNGIANVAAQKAEAYHSLLKDAVTELEAWDPDEEDDDGLITSNSSSSSEHGVSQEDESRASPPLEAAVNGITLTPPPTPSPIRRLLTDSLATLRLIRLLYPALKKRRILTFPAISASTSLEKLPNSMLIERFDALMEQWNGFSENADELAGALYAHDEDDVVDQLNMVKERGRKCVDGMRVGWKGEEDEFTAWIAKWRQRLDEGGTSQENTT